MASLTEMIEDKTIILQLGDEIYELEIDAIGENIIILGSTELEDKQNKETSRILQDWHEWMNVI